MLPGSVSELLHFQIPHLILLKRLSGAQKYLSIVIISSFLIPALIVESQPADCIIIIIIS